MLDRTQVLVIGCFIVGIAIIASLLYVNLVLNAWLEKARWCFDEYRAIDKTIEACVDDTNTTLSQCLTNWPFKHFLIQKNKCGDW